MKRRILVLSYILILLVGCTSQVPQWTSKRGIPVSDLELVRIAGGEFTMGRGNNPNKNEEPPHKVKVSDFSISKTVVPVKLWKAFIEDTEYKEYDFKNALYPEDLYQKIASDESPIFFVNWYESVLFCNWLSVKVGLEPSYEIKGRVDRKSGRKIEVEWRKTANGYRLPTEAEWEYAMREGGKDVDVLEKSYSALFQKKMRTTKIDSVIKEGYQNLLGVYSYPGVEIREYAWDFYGPYTAESQSNPSGPDLSVGSDRVTRSISRGSFTHRAGFYPFGDGDFIGIRVARN